MDNQEYVTQVFEEARSAHLVNTRSDFADALKINRATLSAAMNGNEKYLTRALVGRVREYYEAHFSQDGAPKTVGDLLIIPTEAMAGPLIDFSESVQAYECERMVSPIKGADYAIKVAGDSMQPEIPNGSLVLIKRIYEEEFVEWGKIFLLDTRNGVVIKRVFPTDKEGIVECRSVNPEYPPFRVNSKSVYGWYRVLMVLSYK